MQQTFSDGDHITRWVKATDMLGVFAKITKQQHCTTYRHVNWAAPCCF